MNQAKQVTSKREIKGSPLPDFPPPVATQKKVIKRFTDTVWITNGENTKTEDRSKDRYYPSKGGRLKFSLVEKNGDIYATVKVLEGEPFESRTAMESAFFRVLGNELISSPMIIQIGVPGLALSERLTLSEDGKKMTHHLTFSDGVHGSWVCEK
ncbi:hypothetical protein [Thalassomonas sp. RHCl1]|uniref:hypothetical protein n=1 Tax=Thalassomonas sp. RHCl1 TaxID=2995320 RepID=UPI00248AE2EF|nr:hypothetical protein [Thalassomonas sp. RHCl1]